MQVLQEAEERSKQVEESLARKKEAMLMDEAAHLQQIQSKDATIAEYDIFCQPSCARATQNDFSSGSVMTSARSV